MLKVGQRVSFNPNRDPKVFILCGVIVFAVTIIGIFIKYASIACRNESNNKHDGDES